MVSSSFVKSSRSARAALRVPALRAGLINKSGNILLKLVQIVLVFGQGLYAYKAYFYWCC